MLSYYDSSFFLSTVRIKTELIPVALELKDQPSVPEVDTIMFEKHERLKMSESQLVRNGLKPAIQRFPSAVCHARAPSNAPAV